MKILIVSAHPDDIEMSMGATLARLANAETEMEPPGGLWTKDNEIIVHVFSDSADVKGNDGIQQEVFDSMKLYGLDCTVHKYPTMHFREHYQKIRDTIYKLKQEIDPDVVYCKSPNSLHPDHQVIGEACESIFLECTVYGMFGIRDGHNIRANKWVMVDQAELDLKLQSVMAYKSQQRRSYANSEFIIGQAKMRGMQVGVEYAEAFEVIREVS